MEATDSRIFLTAEWRHLVMLNYHVDQGVLQPFVPPGTEIDTWNGRAYASMVGFLFLRTRVWGLSIPFHRNFEEVNLRFYVRRKGPEGWRRAVVFIKELVPRLAIAWTAKLLYGERYACVPMSHSLEFRESEGRPSALRSAAYRWQSGGRPCELSATVDGDPHPLVPGSEEEFIAEHYWGYAKHPRHGTLEYQVAHPPWRVWMATDCRFAAPVASVYGPAFVDSLSGKPASAFVAEGSAVQVFRGVRLNSF